MYRNIAAAALVLAAVGGIRSQESWIRFSTDPREVVARDQLQDPKSQLDLRPNVTHRRHLFVHNPTGDPRDMTVRVLDIAGKVLAETVVKAVPSGSYARVRFKPPPPPPMPPVVVVQPMPMPPTAAPPPEPPGIELRAVEDPKTKRVSREIQILASYVNNEQRTIENKSSVLVSVRPPTDYVSVAGVRFLKEGTSNALIVELRSTEDFDPPCPVELRFPLQPFLKPGSLRGGDYLRLLKAKTPPTREEGLRADLLARDLPILPGAKESGTAYINVDGVPRAFILKPAFHVENPKGGVVPPLATAGIHITEPNHERSTVPILTLPKDKVLVRVEADAAPANAWVELQLDRGTGVLSTDDVHTRIGTHQERVWIEPAGPDEIFVIHTRVNDWVIPLDTRGMRGVYSLKAILYAVENGKAVAKATSARPFIVDDSPPEVVTVERLPDKHIRTVPLPVRISATDPESGIAKVAVFIGKPTPDGKLPEGAVLVDASKPTADGAPWLVQLPLPPDKKGIIDLAAVATNGVGLATVQVQRVQLLDPPMGGTVKGVATLGGKPQSGVRVVLFNAAGMEMDFAKTDAKGAYEMLNVLPGPYRVTASKGDSGVGTIAEEGVKVEAGKVHTVDLKLARRPPPPKP